MKKRAWISRLKAAVSFVLAAAGCKAGVRPSAGKRTEQTVKQMSGQGGCFLWLRNAPDCAFREDMIQA